MVLSQPCLTSLPVQYCRAKSVTCCGALIQLTGLENELRQFEQSEEEQERSAKHYSYVTKHAIIWQSITSYVNSCDW